MLNTLEHVSNVSVLGGPGPVIIGNIMHGDFWALILQEVVLHSSVVADSQYGRNSKSGIASCGRSMSKTTRATVKKQEVATLF